MVQNKTLVKSSPKAKDTGFRRLLVVFAAVFVLCSLLKGSAFLNLGNFQSMMKQFPEYGLLAVAIAMALLIGGIDLSAVYLANLSTIIAGKFLLSQMASGASEGSVVGLIYASFLLCLGIGALGGALNGFLISGLGIPAMLATLGTQSLFWGLSVVLTGGSTLGGFPRQLSKIVNTSFGIVPLSVILFAIGAVLAGVVVSKSVLGRQMKMYGTNNRATTFAGLNNRKLVVATHMMAGVLAALSGIIMWGRYSSAKPDNGASYTMQAILIAVMGGISPNGGKGSIQGVVVAVLIIQMVSSVLNMYTWIPTACRQIIWGALLLLVMIFNYVNDQRSRKH